MRSPDESRQSMNAMAGVRSSLSGVSFRFAALTSLLLGALAAIGLAAWIAIEHDSAKIGAAVELSVQLEDALDAARAAEVHFKMQVQEWKDMLLRGSEPAAYQRHLASFEKESVSTAQELAELRRLLVQLGLKADLADNALQTHARLMTRYRDALDRFNQGARHSGRDADAMVAAIDREPMRQLDAIVDYVRGESSRLLDAQREAAFDRTHAAKTALVFLVVGTLLAAVLALIGYSHNRIVERSVGIAMSVGNWVTAAALLLLIVGLSILVGRATGDALAAAERIAHPHEVRTHLEQLKAATSAAEDAARDFTIEANPDLEKEFVAAADEVRARIKEFRELPDPGLSAGEIDRLDDLIRTSLSYDSMLVSVRRNGGTATAAQSFAAGAAGPLHDAVANIDQLLAKQESLVSLRGERLAREVSLLHWSLVATAVLALIMLAGLVLLIQRDQHQRRQAQERLESENKRLDLAVQERTASLANANAELARWSQRSLQLQEQERHQLSSELHDEISRQIAALLMNLQRIARTITVAALPELAADLQSSIQIAKTTYREICDLAVNLRPAMLDQLGLIATLQWYARQEPRDAGCDIEIVAGTLPAEPRTDAATVAFRIVQESVRNALRHGTPKKITIEIRNRDALLELCIRDDGIGFDADRIGTDASPSHGLGLFGMRERAVSVGGSLVIRSQRGSGTEVTLTLPDALQREHATE